MPHSAAGSALTALILEVFRLNGRLLSAGEALTRPAGQTSARWQVLGAIDQKSLSVAAIGRYMGLTRQSVQRIADLLESEGLVKYAANPAHRRAKLVALTSRGRAALDRITALQVQWANQIGNRLDRKDLSDALHTIQSVRAAVEEHSNNHGIAARARVPRSNSAQRTRTQQGRRARWRPK
jgi:DNA-binding MarR family transcriptional regulator